MEGEDEKLDEGAEPKVDELGDGDEVADVLDQVDLGEPMDDRYSL